MLGQSSGSVVKNLRAATVRSLPLLLPDNREQRRIGASVSALEELAATHDRIRRAGLALRGTLLPLFLRDPVGPDEDGAAEPTL